MHFVSHTLHIFHFLRFLEAAVSPPAPTHSLLRPHAQPLEQCSPCGRVVGTRPAVMASKLFKDSRHGAQSGSGLTGHGDLILKQHRGTRQLASRHTCQQEAHSAMCPSFLKRFLTHPDSFAMWPCFLLGFRNPALRHGISNFGRHFVCNSLNPTAYFDTLVTQDTFKYTLFC